jgi:hypothetical protein
MEAEETELLWRGFDASGIVASIEVGGDPQTTLGRRGADEVEDLLVAVQRFPGPVFGDLGE